MRVTLILLLALLIIFPASLFATRKIPDDNLAYPVLLTLKNGDTASGFYLESGKNIFLVTAGHVLFSFDEDKLISAEMELRSYDQNPTVKDPAVLHVDLATLLRDGSIRHQRLLDVAVIKLGSVSVEGATHQIHANAGVVFASHGPVITTVGTANVKRFGEVLVANEVIVFGFPTSIGIKQVPQIDYLHPLIRKGIVAGKNDSNKTIVLDCAIYPGNSGGPVLEIDQQDITTVNFRVIGLVTQFVPVAETWENKMHRYTNLSISNSGYSVAASMDIVLALVEELER
jgi:hypothetical protein